MKCSTDNLEDHKSKYGNVKDFKKIDNYCMYAGSDMEHAPQPIKDHAKLLLESKKQMTR